MPESFRDQVSAWMRTLQHEVCAGLVALERSAQSDTEFEEDLWTREGGGGGRTRVIRGGAVFEKGGVNFSEVHGEFTESFAKQIPGSGRTFWAAGVSLVLHPKNPYVPTCHANFRHIVHGDKAWFGGGADLTPYYYRAQDKEHFHRVWRESCERHPQVADYPAFSDRCDRYFYLPHRGERRGVGGIFFDNLWVDAGDPEAREATYAFVRDAATHFLEAYVPLVEANRTRSFGERERKWQKIRRGRYVEFNLVYDRGTIFGLKTGGRTESILMSLPPEVSWDYSHEPPVGSPEAELLEELKQPPPD